MTDQLFQKRIARLKFLGWLALAGGILVAFLSVFSDPQNSSFGVLAFLAITCMIPALVYVVAMTMWHWKGRYKGRNSDLWGVLLVVEVSGWFKLIYLFRHIIPDARRNGRYGQTTVED